MGCDIHLVLERRDRDEWVAVSLFDHGKTAGGDWFFPPATDRNYERFGRLAGVRREGPAPKGFPEDASQSARFFYRRWAGDAHSASHMPLDEAVPIFVDTGPDLNDFDAKYPAAFYFGVESDQVREHRIVFWFDN